MISVSKNRVLLSVGSNVDREKNISAGLLALDILFDSLIYSGVYESDAAGFDGESFYNLVALVETSMKLEQVNVCLKKIEADFGRDFSAPRFSSKKLDIDILCFEDLIGRFSGVDLPREEINYSSYVLFPLAELVPTMKHPRLGKTYFDMAKRFDGKCYGIRRLPESANIYAVLSDMLNKTL